MQGNETNMFNQLATALGVTINYMVTNGDVNILINDTLRITFNTILYPWSLAD
jgi:hypothetical protein